MSEDFYSKDYGEYFRALESRTERQDNQTKAPAQERRGTPARTSRPKRLRVVLGGIAVIAVIAIAVAALVGGRDAPASDTGAVPDTPVTNSASAPKKKLFAPAEITAGTASPDESIVSRHVLVVDLETNRAVAARAADERTSPASTTKIMTVLVAAEQITDYSDTFTMTLEITDRMYLAEATAAGFSNGERITMTDLLYGTILPSGGDAALGLAYKLAGSEEAFAELMNQKAAELGLKNTHFTNVTGLYDPDHYTTAADLAVILRAAMENPVCRQVLVTHPYTTAKTPQHPDGILLESTLFNSMYGTEPGSATIDGGKTGYVNESGFCIASFGHANESGKEYLCVTLGATGKWPSVNDQIKLYAQYAK